MFLVVFLTFTLLATSAVAAAAPPLMGAATVLALAWAGIGWALDCQRAAADELVR